MLQKKAAKFSGDGRTQRTQHCICTYTDTNLLARSANEVLDLHRKKHGWIKKNGCRISEVGT